jgi:CheY-like chemotaxis protein
VKKNSKTLKNSNKLILLGEDDMDDQEFLEEVFLSIDSSYQLQSISNGKNFIIHLDKLDDNDLPCLIILDYNLPQINGAEILKILDATGRYKAIPKVVWSTSNSSVFRAKCLELGALDYIVKPSNIASLKQVAKHIISFCN